MAAAGNNRMGRHDVLPQFNYIMQILKKALLLMVLTAGLLGAGSQGYAREDWCCGPMGGYFKGSGWGWYGARKTVNTVEAARNILQDFFAREEVKIGEIKEKASFFEAEVRDKDKLVDIVIVDKRTGRIRSIY